MFESYIIILGVQRAKFVADLEIVNFSKIVFSLLFLIVILQEGLNFTRICGVIIIAIAIILFNNHRRRNEMLEKISKEKENKN